MSKSKLDIYILQEQKNDPYFKKLHSGKVIFKSEVIPEINNLDSGIAAAGPNLKIKEIKNSEFYRLYKTQYLDVDYRIDGYESIFESIFGVPFGIDYDVLDDDSVLDGGGNDGISASVDRYYEAIESGNFAGAFIDGFTTPANGGFYNSCMKLRLVGCVGAPDSHDEIPDSSIVKKRKTLHNNFDQAENQNEKTAHLKKN